MINLIIFGPPGSGKGTQSDNISTKYGLKHISTGEIFRNEIQTGTDLGKVVKSIIDCGRLVPDKYVMKILESTLDNCKNDHGVIFDGFPRTQFQALGLERILEKRGEKVSIVLSLEVEEDELLKRLISRRKEIDRSDDNVEIIHNRLDVYRDQTEPLIRFYKKKGLYKGIDGIGTVDEIFERICREIEQVL